LQKVVNKYSVYTSWVILSVWVFYTIIHTGVALLQLNAHHQNTEYKLKYKKEKQLVSLTVSPESTEFIRVNKKEFIWQGEWYDIEEITEKNGVLHILAHPDKKEEKLQKNLTKALEHNQEQPQKSKNNIKFELKESYISHIDFLFISPYHSFFTVTYLTADIQSIHLALLKPPPEPYTV
jgi:5S rRNA maturation endonuclease (ribonuclease M5)